MINQVLIPVSKKLKWLLFPCNFNLKESDIVRIVYGLPLLGKFEGTLGSSLSLSLSRLIYIFV